MRGPDLIPESCCPQPASCQKPPEPAPCPNSAGLQACFGLINYIYYTLWGGAELRGSKQAGSKCEAAEQERRQRWHGSSFYDNGYVIREGQKVGVCECGRWKRCEVVVEERCAVQ